MVYNSDVIANNVVQPCSLSRNTQQFDALFCYAGVPGCTVNLQHHPGTQAFSSTLFSSLTETILALEVNIKIRGFSYLLMKKTLLSLSIECAF
jgi:hypothetical protein